MTLEGERLLLNAVYSACLPNAVCLHNASFLPMISAIAFYFHVFFLGLLTHSLFISCINLHHAQCF